MTVAIPDFPDPPSREFPDDFSEKADAVMAAFPGIVAAMNAQNAENNALSADVNTKHGQVIAAAELVSENIDTIEEAVDNLPNLAAKVNKTGDTMTGHLSVPAGATGNQVPRASEVVHTTGAETIAGVKTFTSRPKVPAGATGTEVPQAQEIFGKGQSWQTVTRTSGVTYTNSTGKPIIVMAFGVSNNVDNGISGAVNGDIATWSSFEESGTDLNISFVVPPGSTYKVTAYNVSTHTVKEYR